MTKYGYDTMEEAESKNELGNLLFLFFLLVVVAVEEFSTKIFKG